MFVVIAFLIWFKWGSSNSLLGFLVPGEILDALWIIPLMVGAG